MIKNKKLTAVISIIIIIVLLVSSTIAWFYLSSDVEVDYGSILQVEAGNALEISVDQGESYSGRIKLTEGNLGARLIDITGDGINLFSPQNIDEMGVPSDFQNAEIAKVQDNGSVTGDYLKYEIWFRSVQPLDVFLSGSSFIDPKSTSEDNANLYGKFSKDFISGAIRLSVTEIQDDGSEVLKLLWAPNPQVELIAGSKGTYTLNPNSENREQYYITEKEGSNYNQYPITSSDYANKWFVAGSTNATDLNAASSPILTTLSQKDGEEFCTSKLVLRIWFEGTDREASQALSGGAVNMNFKFTGMQKKHNTELQGQINAIGYSNGVYTNIDAIGTRPVEQGEEKDTLLYSTDGYTWKTYTSVAALPTKGTVFFKGAEKNNYYETACKKIVLSVE